MVIRKVKGKYVLYSKKTKRRLGTYKTKKEALKRERQIQLFNHKRSK